MIVNTFFNALPRTSRAGGSFSRAAVCAFAAALLFFAAARAFSQYGSYGLTDAESVSKGNTFTSTATGLLSVGKNPALLFDSCYSDNAVYFFMPAFSSEAYTNSMSFDDIDYFFGGKEPKYLTEDDKEKLYGYFEGADGQLHYDIALTSFAVMFSPSDSIGSFAFGITDNVSGNFFVPAQLAELLLKGNEKGRKYSFDDLKYESWWARYYSLTYARNFHVADSGFFRIINLGATVKYVNGFAYSGLKNVRSSFYTGNNNSLSGFLSAGGFSSFSEDLPIRYDFDSTTPIYNYNYFTRPAGFGAGVDLGFYAVLRSNLRVGAALTDVGFISWNRHVAKHTIESDLYIDDIFNEDQLDSLIEFTDVSTDEISSYDTPLPTCLRLGASYDLADSFSGIPGSLIAAVDYNQGLNNSPSNALIPRFSLGAKWIPGCYYPSVSAGLTYDRIGHVRTGLGLGYDYKFIKFYVSTFDCLSLLSPNTFTPQASVAFNFLWKIY